MKGRLTLAAAFLVAISACAEDTREPASFHGDGCVLDLESALCDDCIEFAHVTTLGSDQLGPGFLVDDGTLDDFVRDSLGNYWVGQGEQIKVFDADGAFLRTVGRRGDGPMEFHRAEPVHVDAAGRVHVFDTRQLRVSVIGQDWTLVEEKKLPPSVSARAPLDDGERYVVQNSIGAPGREGMLIHIIDGAGDPKSFEAGEEADGEPWAEQMRTDLRLAAGPDGSVLAGRQHEYVIEAWSQEGERLGGLRGEPLLNPVPLRLEAPSPDNPLPNMVGQIRPDSDGLLWVSLMVRRVDWLETLFPDPSGDDAGELTAENFTGVFQGRLDVIDLATCTLVASQLQDQLLLLLDDRTVLGYGITGLGANTLDVMRVWLDR